MRATRYRAGDRRYLAVDAEHYVPDREAFAAHHCDAKDGVVPPEYGAGSGLVHVDQGISGPRGGPGVTAADGGPDPDRERRTIGADGVCFLALEPAFSPPRVVLTVVRPDGDRSPTCTRAVRCAARWVAERTDADRVMVDTQAGTREARIHPDGTVSVEPAPGGTRQPDEADMKRGPVVREFETDVERSVP